MFDREVYIMENNGYGFTTSDAVLTAAMSGGLGGRGGYGGGLWGGGGDMLGAGNSVLAADAHANGTATKEAVNCNSQKIEDQADFTRDIISSDMAGIRQSFENQTRTSEFASIRDGQFRTELRSSDQHAENLKAIADIEFRSLDRQRDIESLIIQNAKDAAKCCCDAKLQSCKDTAEVKALVIAENSATRELIRGDALAAANARITQLETINALQSNGHGHHGGRWKCDSEPTVATTKTTTTIVASAATSEATNESDAKAKVDANAESKATAKNGDDGVCVNVTINNSDTNTNANDNDQGQCQDQGQGQDQLQEQSQEATGGGEAPGNSGGQGGNGNNPVAPKTKAVKKPKKAK